MKEDKKKVTGFEKRWKVDIGGVSIYKYLIKLGLPSLARAYRKVMKVKF